MKWLILVLGIAANASCQRTGQDGHDAPRRFPSLADPLAALSNWPSGSALGLYGGDFPALCRCTGQVALECCPPGTDFRGGSNGRTFFPF